MGPGSLQCDASARGVGIAVPFLIRGAEGEEMSLGLLWPLGLPVVFPRSCFSDHYLCVNTQSLSSECRLQAYMWWNGKWLLQNGRLEGRPWQHLCCIRLRSFWQGFCSGWQGFCEAFTCRQKMLRREEIVEHHQCSTEANCLLRHRGFVWQKIT